MVFVEAGLAPEEAADRLAEAEPVALNGVIERLTSARLERLVVVDATPSAEVARCHPALLHAGIAVVTPNKAATSVDAAAWAEARRAALDGEAPYLYETTVGAGLGIIATLRDLLRTGDTIHRIEGVLSGTLAFVLHAMREGAAFSEAVRLARLHGYAEPDPRDDLSGHDVARKLATLARELGLSSGADDAVVENLLPAPLRDLPWPAVAERLSEHDAAWKARMADAGGPLHYVARLDADGSIHAGVEAVGDRSPFAGLRGPTLAVAFHTARYAPEPLVIRGPGASADVTAAVLLADLVRAAEAMH
jgi:aspartokinase/homoserine dehydrogenase 1